MEAASTTPSPEIPEEARLGEVLVREKLITPVQLREALREQQENPETAGLLGQILVEQGALSREQLTSVLDRHQKRSRLGDILVRLKAITADQLGFALDYQNKHGLRLGDSLVKLSFITDKAMKQALSAHLNVPFIDLDTLVMDRSVAVVLSADFAQTNRVIAVERSGETLTVAMDDPTDTGVIKAIQTTTGCTVEVIASTRAAFQRAFVRAYGEDPDAQTPLSPTRLEFLTEDRPELGEIKLGEDIRRGDDMVRSLIALAMRWNATDIHLEALDHGAHVRFRIDGVLQDVNLGAIEDAIPRNYREIVSRVKILGNMDIAERRRPQEGSFRARVAERGRLVKVNFRISIIPGYFGENVVFRVLDPRRVPATIQQLGFSKQLTDGLLGLVRHTAGLVLITGPTGCGKTSSLYALLSTLARPDIRILTAEDPVEYVFENFSQFEVNDKIGNNYASYIRAFLHHDPEVIMIGEILDQETAEMTFRAAQTGHLLLSSLHTNDAVGSVPRLIDLQVSANLIGSTVLGVLCQRLVRTVCPQCREEYTPPEELLDEFTGLPAGLRWYHGRGCPPCNFTGYRGRVAVGELWTPSGEDVQLITERAQFEKIRTSSRQTTVPMVADVFDKLATGKTNLEELKRTLPQETLAAFRQPQPAFRLGVSPVVEAGAGG